MTHMLRVENESTGEVHLVTTDDLFVGVVQNGDTHYQPAYALGPDGKLHRLPGVPDEAYESGRFVLRRGGVWIEVSLPNAP